MGVLGGPRIGAGRGSIYGMGRGGLGLSSDSDSPNLNDELDEEGRRIRNNGSLFMIRMDSNGRNRILEVPEIERSPDYGIQMHAANILRLRENINRNRIGASSSEE